MNSIEHDDNIVPHTEEFNQGWNARMNITLMDDQKWHSCPYDPNSLECKLWESGWSAAQNALEAMTL